VSSAGQGRTATWLAAQTDAVGTEFAPRDAAHATTAGAATIAPCHLAAGWLRARSVQHGARALLASAIALTATAAHTVRHASASVTVRTTVHAPTGSASASWDGRAQHVPHVDVPLAAPATVGASIRHASASEAGLATRVRFACALVTRRHALGTASAKAASVCVSMAGVAKTALFIQGARTTATACSGVAAASATSASSKSACVQVASAATIAACR